MRIASYQCPTCIKRANVSYIFKKGTFKKIKNIHCDNCDTSYRDVNGELKELTINE